MPLPQNPTQESDFNQCKGSHEFSNFLPLMEATEVKLLLSETAIILQTGPISQDKMLPRREHVSWCFPCSPHTRWTQLQAKLLLHTAGLRSLLHNSDVTTAKGLKILANTFNNEIGSSGFLRCAHHTLNLLTKIFKLSFAKKIAQLSKTHPVHTQPR